MSVNRPCYYWHPRLKETPSHVSYQRNKRLNIATTSKGISHDDTLYYSQTLENKSSAPANPPTGLVVATGDELGTALAHPPKSSSEVTVGSGFEEDAAPQPVPMSLAVRVSGTFIIEAVDVTGGSEGAGSGVVHALSPQGSMVDERRLVAVAVVLVTSVVGTNDGSGFGSGLERLKADLKSCSGDVWLAGWGVGLDGGAGVVPRPNGSKDRDDGGGEAGFAGAGLELFISKLLNEEVRC